MLPFNKPDYAVRSASSADAGLIGYLRLASLLCLEMPRHSLAEIRTLMDRLPDVDARLVGAGTYVVAESGGELIAGAGWSDLPLSLWDGGLVDERGAAVSLRLGNCSALIRGFFLDPDLGRRGAGCSVLATIEAQLLATGRLGAELVVPASAEVAYRRLGFRPVRRLGLTVANGDVLPLLQMRKPLGLRLAEAA